MERKTKIHAEEGKHDLTITREFELPVELLFRAHVEPEIFEEWMSHEYGTTKVLKLETQKHGSFTFQTTDPKGNVVFKANGAIHDLVPDKKIIRTFEMENSPFDVTLEFLEFESVTEDTSKLTMQIIYRTAALRDQHLKMPFEWGMNMAHNRLQKIVSKLK
jgi:uncharacterized protein YndB with AHSA1/START domain